MEETAQVEPQRELEPTSDPQPPLAPKLQPEPQIQPQIQQGTGFSFTLSDGRSCNLPFLPSAGAVVVVLEQGSLPPPDYFLCALTRKLMCDPVMAPDGHVYDRSAIEAHLADKGTSPFTKQKMSPKKLLSNTTLKLAIDEWQRRGSLSASTPTSSPPANLKSKRVPAFKVECPQCKAAISSRTSSTGSKYFRCKDCEIFIPDPREKERLAAFAQYCHLCKQSVIPYEYTPKPVCSCGRCWKCAKYKKDLIAGVKVMAWQCGTCKNYVC